MTSIRRSDEWPALNSPRKSSSVHTEVTKLQWNFSTLFTIYYQLTCTIILLEMARDTIPPEKVKIISKLQFSRMLSFLLVLWNSSSLEFEWLTIHMLMLPKVASGLWTNNHLKEKNFPCNWIEQLQNFISAT